jgi:hypothetical protein
MLSTGSSSVTTSITKSSPTTQYAAASPNHFNLWGYKPFYFSRSRVVPQSCYLLNSPTHE